MFLGRRRQYSRNESLNRLLVFGIRRGPAHIDLGFVQRLGHVFLDSANEVFPICTAFHRQRPCTYQRLIEEVFFIRIWCCTAICKGALLPLVRSAPLQDFRCPFLGDLRKHIQARSHIFAAFAVMGGRCQHRRRPIACSLAIRLVELLHADPKLCRRSAHFVHGNKPVVNVAGRVFQSLGHYGPESC